MTLPGEIKRCPGREWLIDDERIDACTSLRSVTQIEPDLKAEDLALSLVSDIKAERDLGAKRDLSAD